MSRNTILIVEDDQVVLNAMEAVLSAAGYRVLTADTCSSGLSLALEESPALLVLDINLPDGTGWNLLDSFHGARPNEVMHPLRIAPHPNLGVRQGCDDRRKERDHDTRRL